MTITINFLARRYLVATALALVLFLAAYTAASYQIPTRFEKTTELSQSCQQSGSGVLMCSTSPYTSQRMIETKNEVFDALRVIVMLLGLAGGSALTVLLFVCFWIEEEETTAE